MRVWAVEGGRFILHPRETNARLLPPPMRLPSPREVTLRFRGARRVVSADMKSWFYQLCLPTHLEGAFVFYLADDHRPYTLRRWPMGLVPAPALAQAVMEELVMVGVGGRCDTMTYVDDVALVEPTDEDVKALVEGAKAMGAEIGKCGDSAVTGSFVWVGIEWRVGGDFRPAEKLTGKLLARGPGGGDGRGQID